MSATELVFLLSFSFFISTTCGYGEPAQNNYSDGLSPPTGCGNCTVCQYPCKTPPSPPPASGYPSYGAPPPPPGQVHCPPAPVQCCQYSPPTPFYYPYSNYSGSAQLQPMTKPFTSTWSLAIFFVAIIFFGLQV